MGDKTQGLYDKFIIRRVDRTDEPSGKHHGCRYFVLDLDHDPFAAAAIAAYAETCAGEYPRLATDLRKLAPHRHLPTTKEAS